MSEKTKARISKINNWCVTQSADFFENIMRDFKSLKALWNYLMLALFTWVCVWCVLYHAETCANTVIVTVGGLVGTIFTGYIWASNSEKKAARQFPAYSQTTETTQSDPSSQTTSKTTATSPVAPATPDGEGDDGNG